MNKKSKILFIIAIVTLINLVSYFVLSHFYPEIIKQYIIMDNQELFDTITNMILISFIVSSVMGIYFYIQEYVKKRKIQEDLDEIVELTKELEKDER